MYACVYVLERDAMAFVERIQCATVAEADSAVLLVFLAQLPLKQESLSSKPYTGERPFRAEVTPDVFGRVTAFVTAAVFLLTACGGGTEAQRATFAPAVRHHVAGTITFSPASLTINGEYTYSSFNFTDSDSAATIASATVSSPGVAQLNLNAFPGYYLINSQLAGTTSFTFTDSDGNTGTLPVTVVASPIEFAPTSSGRCEFDEVHQTCEIVVEESGGTAFTATSSNTSVVTVAPGTPAPSVTHRQMVVLHPNGRKPSRGHGPHTISSERAFTVTSTGFGTATIGFSDTLGNVTQAPAFVTTPTAMTVDPNTAITFTGALGQQLTFQVQEVGTHTFTATTDDAKRVTVEATGAVRHIRRHAGTVVSTQVFTAQSVGLDGDSGIGHIAISDGTNSISYDYSINDVIWPDPPSANVLGLGAANAAVVHFYENDDFDGTMSATSSNPAVATVSGPVGGYPYAIAITGVSVPSNGMPISITVKDGLGNSTTIPVTVTATVGTINTRRSH
jgi:hypothetical protein